MHKTKSGYAVRTQCCTGEPDNLVNRICKKVGKRRQIWYFNAVNIANIETLLQGLVKAFALKVAKS